MLVIRDRNTGTLLDIPDDISIPFTFNNPFLDDEFILGNNSLLFHLPKTERNKAFFGFVDHPQAASGFLASYDVDIEHSGAFFQHGSLKVIRCSDTYECGLLSGIGIVSEQLKNTLLPEINYGTETIKAEYKYAVYHLAGVFTFGDYYEMTINGGTLYTTSGSGLNAVDSAYALVDLVNSDPSGEGWAKYDSDTEYLYICQRTPGSSTSLTMWFRCIDGPSMAITNFTPPSQTQADVPGDPISDDDMDFFMTHCNSIPFDEKGFCFLTLQNQGAFAGSNNTNYQGYINNISDTTWQVTPYLNQYAITPFPYLLYVLKKCLNSLGFSPKGTAYTDEELRTLCLYNNRIIDQKGALLPLFEYIFDVSKHLPSVSIKTLIDAFRHTFAIAVIFNEDDFTTTFTALKDILNRHDCYDITDFVEPSPAKEPATTADGYTFTFTPDGDDSNYTDCTKTLDGQNVQAAVAYLVDLPPYDITLSTNDAIGSIRLVIAEDKYYILKKDTDGTPAWQYYSDNHYNLKIGNGKTTIDSGMSTLLMASEALTPIQVVPGEKWLVPTVHEEVLSQSFDQTSATIPMRFIFNRGQWGDSASYGYYLGSSGTVNYAGTSVGDRSLKWDGTKGLYEVSHKDWLAFKDQAIPYIYTANNINIVQLKKLLDWAQPKRIESNEFIIKQVQVTLYKYTIGTARVELLRK